MGTFHMHFIAWCCSAATLLQTTQTTFLVNIRASIRYRPIKLSQDSVSSVSFNLIKSSIKEPDR